MSFSNTLAFAIARAADVATASVFTQYKDVTISTECDVALGSANGHPFLKRLGKTLNWISPGHTKGARQADIANAKAALAYMGVNLNEQHG